MRTDCAACSAPEDWPSVRSDADGLPPGGIPHNLEEERPHDDKHEKTEDDRADARAREERILLRGGEGIR